MFPNFESLAQREQKRQELLERAQRRVQQAKAKRLMYEGAAWATDADKTISALNSKTSISTQTDSTTESSEDLKKTVSDEFSQKNPEVSTTGTNTEPIEVNVRPVMIDAAVDNGVRTKDAGVDSSVRMEDSSTNTNRVMSTDRNIQISPDTADAGISSTPEMVDGSTSMETKRATDSNNVDNEDQVDSRNWIKAFFKENPNWAAIGIHPIKKKNGKDDSRFVIGTNGSVRSVKTGNKYKIYGSIDWVATESKIRDIWYEGESRSIDEVGAMRNEEARTRMLLRLKNKKRAGDELEDLDVILKDRRLPDIHFGRKSTSTTSDNDQSRLRLFWIISKNKDMLESNGLKKSIAPVFKDKYKPEQDEYVWVENGSLDVFGVESNLKHKASSKKVDWQSTLRAFLKMVNSRGLELTIVGPRDVERDIKSYEPVDDEDAEARHGTKTGLDADSDQNLSIPDNEAKKIMYEYYKSLFERKVQIPFRLHPVVDSKTGVKTHESYYFGAPSENRYITIRNKEHKIVSGDALAHLMKTIRWMDAFLALLSQLEDAYRTASDIEAPASKEELKMIDNVNANLKVIRAVIFSNADDIKQESVEPYEHDELLQKLHDEAELAFQEYGEAQKQLEIIQKQEKATQNEVKGSNSVRSKSALKAARSAFRAAKAAVRATRTVYNTKAKKYHGLVRELEEGEERERAADEFANHGRGFRLKGRGLKGAGVAPLEGVVRRGRTYNLNEIQGLATPSAYVYRQLGSKYIRLPDLDAKTLVIVQPNRRKCGPKCQISDSLQAMIRTLVYKQHIDQPAYDKLSTDDKKMFKEILAIIHLQYNFHDKLEDPLETLKAEYDKLKGELELGNDNPSIIKQLKSLTVDMYSNRLIDDKEFKQIITRLL